MSTDRIRILYLDDEENNLTSFKAAFRRDYKIYTTTTAQEAVQILNNEEIHIVISDQKMPNISGVEFFELIVQDFPDPIRMLLTGYADIEAVIDAINKGQVYRYIAKPWNDTELKMTIENAFDTYHARKQIKEKNAQLEKAYTELEKFVYSASHDLRAPLVSILGVIKLARAENPDNQNLGYIEMIEQSVSKLDVFVQNIINYYQNLKVAEMIEPADFKAIVDDVLSSFEHFEGREEVNITLEIKQEGTFNTDALRMKIILSNLISNAIKYRDQGKSSPSIAINISTDEQMARLEVADNGKGISREHLGKVFDMFYRSNENSLGTGIGLYIVKEAVEKLGGTINVESELDQGASFILEIPNKL